MGKKPGWSCWLAWVAAYSLLDEIAEALLHGGPAWRQAVPAVKGAVLGATLTWFFSLWRWYKAQDRF